MNKVPTNVRRMMMILTAAASLLVVITAQAVTCPYSRLQVLVPGEEPAPWAEGGKTGTPLPQVAGVPFNVLIRACDDDWDPVESVKHVFRITSTDMAAILPNSQPTQFGELIVTVILNTYGNHTISATDLTDREHYSAVSSEITVVGGAGDAESLVFSQIDAGQTAGEAFYLEIRAADHNGETDPGYSSAVSLAQVTSIGPGRIYPESVVLSGGRWSGMVTLFLADESMTECTGGSVRITGVAEEREDRASIQGMSNCFTVIPGELARLQVVVPGQSRRPGTLSGLDGAPATQLSGYSFKVEIFATDEYWNKVSCTHAFRLMTSDHAVGMPWAGVLEEGYLSLDVSLLTAGTQTFTVTDESDCEHLGMTTEGIPVITDEPVFIIEPIEGPLTAGVPVDVLIRVVDGQGQPIDGYNGYAMLAADTGPGTIEPETIRFNGGSWSGEMTFFSATGELLFSCIDFVVPPNIGTSGRIEVLPGEYAGLQIVLPGELPTGGMTPGLEGQPAGQTAGSTFDLLVRAVDSWWNTVTEIDGTVLITSTDAYAEFDGEISFAEGEALVRATLYRAGEHTFEVSDASETIPAGRSSEFTVHPGPYTQIIAIAPGEELIPGSPEGKAGAPLDQTISHSFTLRVIATDDWWNPVGSVDDMIELTTTDPLAELPGGCAMIDGVAEIIVRLSTGGYQLLNAANVSNTSMREASTQVRAINSGFHYEAVVTPSQVIAGESFTLEVRVTNDAGAVMQEINSFATIDVINADDGTPGGGALLSPQFQILQGKKTIRQTYTKAEPIVLVIRDGDGNEPGMTNTLQIDPAPPAGIGLESELPWIGSRKSMTITASVTDEYGNGVPEQPVLFELTGGAGEIVQIDEFTDSGGLARAEFRSPYQPDIGMVRVLSGEFDALLEIETAHVDPTSPGGTVTNYPNPFHPGESSTRIAYKLDDDAQVTMKLFTLSGNLVFKKTYTAGGPGGVSGLNEIEWDGRNGKGQVVASGGYVLFIEAVRSGETIHTMRRRVGVVR